MDHEGTVEVLQQEIKVIILFNPWCTGNVLSFVWGWSESKDWSMWDRGGDGRDLGKSKGRGDVVLHELFYRSTAKKRDGMWCTQTLTFQLVLNSILNV